MDLQELQKDRHKWLQWRKGGLGSSDAPIIMGVSKWKKPKQLFDEKIGAVAKESASNFAIDRGNELEPIARRKFAARFNALNDCNEDFAPALFMSDDLPFMRASLDGCSKDAQEIVEIKFMGKEPHAEVAQGKVPAHYYPQLQWLLMVSDAKLLHFVSINKEKEILTCEVPRNEEYMATLIRTATRFWSCVERGIWDFEGTEGNMDEGPLPGILEQRRVLKRAIKNLEEEVAQLETKAKELSENKDVKLPSGYGITWVERVGSVNYAKIPELKGVDLEPYRGKASRYPKFLEPKNEED